MKSIWVRQQVSFILSVLNEWSQHIKQILNKKMPKCSMLDSLVIFSTLHIYIELDKVKSNSTHTHTDTITYTRTMWTLWRNIWAKTERCHRIKGCHREMVFRKLPANVYRFSAQYCYYYYDYYWINGCKWCSDVQSTAIDVQHQYTQTQHHFD